MCWYGNLTNIDFKVSEDDKIVYKVGHFRKEGKFDSYYERFSYILNKECEKVNIIMQKEIGDNFSVSAGYHSYSSDSFLRIIRSDKFEDEFIVRGNNGTTICNGNYFGNCFIGKFVIPKGTKYYENSYGEIVSECIKYVGIIDDSGKMDDSSFHRFTYYDPAFSDKDNK
jgi:hypothetical protein